MLRRIYSFIYLLLPICLYGQSHALQTIAPEYELEHIKLNFKSESGTFHDIIEDKEGNLWISSSQGLHVYDGHHVITYRTDNKAFSLAQGASNNSFFNSTADQTGNLWIINNRDRLVQFNTVKRKITDSLITKLTPEQMFYKAAVHPESGLYFTLISYHNPVISIYHKTLVGKTEKIFETAYDIKSDIHYCIAGNYHWILEGNNAIRLSLDGKNVTRYAYPNRTSAKLLFSSAENSIYVADLNQQAIYTWNESTDKLELFIRLPHLIIDNVQQFYVDKDKVYLGSNLSLYIIDLTTHTFQDISAQFSELARKEAPISLSESLVYIVRQTDGSILLVTYKNIFRLKKKVAPESQFRQNSAAENIVSKPASYRALAEDDNKNVFASYYTGISKKTAGKTQFSQLPVNQYINSSFISTYSLNYWKGFLLWNNVKIEMRTGKYRYMFGQEFSGHCTQFLHHDSVWLYQWGSTQLHCYSLKEDRVISYPLELSINFSTSTSGLMDINDIVAAADEQNLWAGSHFFGLCLISKKGKLIRQYKKNELTTSDNYITDLELRGDKLWFGCTDGLGLLNTVTGKIQIYKNPVIGDGRLVDRAVFSILPDGSGNFYLGSSKGILYFDTKTTSFFNLAEGHPLSAPEFNRASALRTSDNRYYFGSTDGLYSFTPGELEFLKSSNAIRPLKLYALSVFSNKDNSYHYLSEDLDSLGKLVLNPFNSNIEFSFSVPEFHRNVYYSYRVKEQGDTWTEYRPDNKIQLYGLQPGQYTLEVKASTSLSDENASYYSLPILMRQVWYKKVWVVSLFIITVIMLLFGLLRYRYNQKIKRQKDLAALRTKISSDLHDDVGTILSGLAMQSQMLTYSVNEEHKEALREISNMSREAMEHMRDTVWAMDSRKDKYENLVDRMRDFAEKNLPLKKITHEFIIENVEGKKFIDPEKRQAIYLIFKEAITNILKHSDAKHVTICFTEEKNKIRLSVKDNGSEKEKVNSDGLGLSNMKMRAEKMGGSFTANYENGFIVDLKI